MTSEFKNSLLLSKLKNAVGTSSQKSESENFIKQKYYNFLIILYKNEEDLDN